MQLNHYLNFQGQAEQAFNFYKSVFGGEFGMLSRYGDMPAPEGVTLSEADKIWFYMFLYRLMSTLCLWPQIQMISFVP